MRDTDLIRERVNKATAIDMGSRAPAAEAGGFEAAKKKAEDTSILGLSPMTEDAQNVIDLYNQALTHFGGDPNNEKFIESAKKNIRQVEPTTNLGSKMQRRFLDILESKAGPADPEFNKAISEILRSETKHPESLSSRAFQGTMGVLGYVPKATAATVATGLDIVNPLPAGKKRIEEGEFLEGLANPFDPEKGITGRKWAERSGFSTDRVKVGDMTLPVSPQDLAAFGIDLMDPFLLKGIAVTGGRMSLPLLRKMLGDEGVAKLVRAVKWAPGKAGQALEAIPRVGPTLSELTGLSSPAAAEREAAARTAEELRKVQGMNRAKAEQNAITDRWSKERLGNITNWLLPTKWAAKKLEGKYAGTFKGADEALSEVKSYPHAGSEALSVFPDETKLSSTAHNMPMGPLGVNHNVSRAEVVRQLTHSRGVQEKLLKEATDAGVVIHSKEVFGPMEDALLAKIAEPGVDPKFRAAAEKFLSPEASLKRHMNPKYLGAYEAHLKDKETLAKLFKERDDTVKMLSEFKRNFIDTGNLNHNVPGAGSIKMLWDRLHVQLKFQNSEIGELSDRIANISKTFFTPGGEELAFKFTPLETLQMKRNMQELVNYAKQSGPGKTTLQGFIEDYMLSPQAKGGKEALENALDRWKPGAGKNLKVANENYQKFKPLESALKGESYLPESRLNDAMNQWGGTMGYGLFPKGSKLSGMQGGKIAGGAVANIIRELGKYPAPAQAAAGSPAALARTYYTTKYDKEKKKQVGQYETDTPQEYWIERFLERARGR